METQNMKELMNEIKEVTKKQKAASRVDEIRVMRGMLNDPDYSVSVFDRSKGYIGSRCPRDEAVAFIGSVSSAITGLDSKSAAEIAKDNEFTKKDAIFLIDNAKDFIDTYLETGRKLPIVQNEATQAALIKRHVDSKEKKVSSVLMGNSSSNKVESGTVTIPAFDKVVCKSNCPKYLK